MQQQYDNIDTFLRNATFQVEDNGFSDRVLQSLPERAEWERKLQRIWQLICLSVALIVGWWTHALDSIMTDIKHVFLIRNVSQGSAEECCISEVRRIRAMDMLQIVLAPERL